VRKDGGVAYSWDKLQNKDLRLQRTEWSRSFDERDIAQIVFGVSGEIGEIEGGDLKVINELDGSESILLHSLFSLVG